MASTRPPLSRASFRGGRASRETLCRQYPAGLLEPGLPGAARGHALISARTGIGWVLPLASKTAHTAIDGA